MAWLPKALSWVAESRRAAVLLVAAAIAVRLALAAAGGFEPRLSEVHQVAVTMAQTGEIANAYQKDSGPTTHTGPLSPALAAFVYWLLGVDSLPAEIVLTVLAACVIATTGFVWNVVFRDLGTPAWPRGLALLFVLLVPLHARLEVQDLRVRETALAAGAISLVVWAALRLERAQKITWAQVTLLSLLVAVLFLLSPAAAVGAYAVCGLLTLRKVGWKRWLGVGAVAAAALVLVSAPWAIRNQRVFGELIWSRGNYGLEYTLGTNPALVDPPDLQAADIELHKRLHPFRTKAAYNRMVQAGGEIAYAHQLQAMTDAWVAAHPLQAARLWARHFVEFYLPPPWVWNAHLTPFDYAKLITAHVITILGLIGVALALGAREWRFLYVALPAIMVSLPYIVLQPRVRYRYVIASLLVFLACDLVGRLARRWTSRSDVASTVRSRPSSGRRRGPPRPAPPIP